MCFRVDDVPPTYGTPISSVSTWRNLGVIFSDTLSWSDHYRYISQRALAKVSLIRTSFSPYSPVCVTKMLYFSLMRSQLSYSSQLWRPMLIKDIVSYNLYNVGLLHLFFMTGNLIIGLGSLHFISFLCTIFLNYKMLYFLYPVSNIQIPASIFMILCPFPLKAPALLPILNCY